MVLLYHIVVLVDGVRGDNMKRKIRVLSIDGGGIRGIIPAKVIVKIEELLQQYSQNPETRISDYFDLIAGTSTGSILAALYLCPYEIGGTKVKYSAQEALDLYLNYGADIFERSWKTQTIDYFGLGSPLYKADKLEQMLDAYFGDIRLADLVKPCLFPAYDIESGKAIFFNQINAYHHMNRNYLVKEVVRGSTAAPTYFPIAKISDHFEGRTYSLIDGGMFANNPALCAYIEACKFPFQPSPSDIMILSLGTGSNGRTYPYGSSSKWGKIGWVIPVIDIYGSAASQTVDHQLKVLYQCHHVKDQYLRIEPDLSQYDVSPQMANVSKKNMKALESVGEKLVETYSEEIKNFTRKLYVSQIGRQSHEFYRLD